MQSVSTITIMSILRGYLFILLFSVFILTSFSDLIVSDQVNHERKSDNSAHSLGVDWSTNPSVEPSMVPSLAPSLAPSVEPSLSPSVEPSLVPSVRPTLSPTRPTVAPSPSKGPTRVPTYTPTFKPSNLPSKGPTRLPTASPSVLPTNTDAPTVEPTNAPSVVPTTAAPTNFPVLVKTSFPTLLTQFPSVRPSRLPTVTATISPTVVPSAAPSIAPSVRPTLRPTTAAPTYKTESPTYSLDAPPIRSVSVLSTTSTSATLRVSLQDTTHYSGSLYCAAFTPGSVVSTVNQVISTGSSVPFDLNVTSLSVTVTGLMPLNQYEAYCVAKNIFGNTNLLVSVKQNQVTLTAACCRSVSFTNAPSFVYGASDYYLGGGVPLSSFVFSYSLSALPSDTLTVTPTLWSTTDSSSSLSGNVSFSPPFLSFSAASTSLAGSFVLTASNQFAVTATLALRLSGSSSGQFYSAVNHTVHILALGSYAPAPSLSAARFSDSGYNVLVSFSAPTDQAGVAAAVVFPCSHLLDFQSAASSSCLWVNSSVVKVTPSSNSSSSGSDSNGLVTVGSPISLLGGVVKARCSSLNFTACGLYNKFSANQTVTLQGPLTALLPSVALVVPSIISSCDNLSISAVLSTGSGGRPFTAHSWSVSGVGVSESNISAILAHLNSYSAVQIAQQQLTLPSHLLAVTTYSLTLSLTNFFGYTGSSSVSFEVSNNLNIPSLSIVGGNSWSILSSQELTVYASAALSSCANSVEMTYSWHLYLGGSLVTSVQSISVDPSAYLLLPYSLASGHVYTLSVTARVPVSGGRAAAEATTSRDIVVASGAVRAAIKGGSTLQILPSTVLVLDASISYDENSLLLGNSTSIDTSATTSQLSYQWSCSFVSYADYGQVCDEVLSDVVTNASTLLIRGENLTTTSTYAFSVLVTAADGRHDNSRVIVTVYESEDPEVVLSVNDTATTFISSRVVKFNPDSQLSLFGSVAALTDIRASWLCFENGAELNISQHTLTPSVKLLPAVVVAQRTSFPVVILPNTFSAGAILTFRLQASGYASDFVTYSEMSVSVNTPPVGGLFTVSPLIGEALSTLFTLNTANWVDDPEDFPLSFSFSYSTSSAEDTSQLYVKSRNALSSATATLSAGGEASNYAVYVVARAFDSYLACAQLSQTLTVTPSDVDVVQYLSDQLFTAFSSSNNNQANAAISNAGNTLNAVNCSFATAAYCAELNRASCTGSNTCGACLSGFDGISGASNTLCHNASSSSNSNSNIAGLVGDPCVTGADCLYGSCGNDSLCKEPAQTCPSSCSGRGVCMAFDISGNFLDTPCGLFDPFCSVGCVCSDGYGGADCSLTNATAQDHDQTRYLLCQGISRVANTSNPSLLLLEQLTNALAVSFSPSEILSSRSYLSCIDALSSIALLVDSGYLIGSSSSSGIAQNLITLASRFVAPSTSAFQPSFTTNATFAGAISYILSGLEKSVASGQSGVSFSSGNIRISIRRDLVIDLENSELQAPPTDSEAAYGYKSSKITLSPEVAAMCDSGNGYAKMSLLQWGNNPYKDTSLGSPVLRTSAKTCAGGSASRRRRRLDSTTSSSGDAYQSRELTDIWTNSSRTERNADNSTLIGLFYITLQFATEQNFDFSIDPASVVYANENTTFPECKMFDGTSFVDCEGCQISHYTNFNVTYACTDGSVLCGSCGEDEEETADADVRALTTLWSASSSEEEQEEEQEEEMLQRLYFEAAGRGQSSYSLLYSLTTTSSSSSSGYLNELSRRLQSLSGDDDGTTSSGKVTSGQFAAIMTAVKTEIAVVLSFNPFRINVQKAEPILIFVSILFFVIFGGLIYFIRWDRFDHNMMLYSNKVNVQVALMMKKAALDQQGSHYDHNHYQELKKFFEDKREKLMNRKRWQQNQKQRKNKSFIAQRKCAVTGEVLDEDHSGKMDHSLLDGEGHLNIGDENTERDYLLAAKEVGYDTILDIPSVNQEFVSVHDKFIINTVAAFLGYVIPIASSEADSERFYNHVANKHDYTSMFSDPSLFLNRTNRWLNVCMQLMLSLFLDTIFFGMFFPDEGTCEALHSESSCTGIINKATNTPLCKWERDRSAAHTFKCSINYPPNTVAFIVLVATLTILFAVPVSFLFDYLRIKVCTRRPDFSTKTLGGKVLQSSTKNTVNEENRHSTLHDLYSDIDAKRRQDADYQMHLMARTSEEYQQKALEEVNELARKVYDGVTSSGEEVDQILHEVQTFLNVYVLTSKTPWNSTLTAEAIRAKATAIQRYIGVYPDGTPVPLSLFDLLWYGNSREKLRSKLMRSRRKARRIASHLTKMGDLEANNKDMSLIQFFILEQFDPVKRYALRYQFFNFPVSTPNTINPWIWCLTWSFLLGVLLFFIYWTLAWGVQSGGHTFRAWGLNFILAFVEDVFMIQLVKIYVLYVLAMFSIRPQLGFIYATLTKVAIKYAQEGPTDDDSIRVVQHLSAACRAARSTACKDLAAAKILSQIDDADMRNCRKNGRTPLPLVAFLIVLIPAVLTLIFNDSFGDMVMSSILPSLFTIFVMVNYYIYTASVIFLVIIWAAVAAFVYWAFYRRRRAKRRAKLARESRVSLDAVKDKNVIEFQHHSHELRLSKRSVASESVKKYLLYARERLLDVTYWAVSIVVYPVVYFRSRHTLGASDERRLNLHWAHMNHPWEVQGCTLYEVREPTESEEQPIREFPFFVQNVMASEWRSEEWSESVKPDYLTGLLNKHLLNVRDCDLSDNQRTTFTGAATSAVMSAVLVPKLLQRKQSMVPRSVRQREALSRSQSSRRLADTQQQQQLQVSSQDEADDRRSEAGQSVVTLESMRGTEGAATAAGKVNFRMPQPRRQHSSSSTGSGSINSRQQHLRKMTPSASAVVVTGRVGAAPWESQQCRDFRDKYTITDDEYVALRRMLLRFLGERQPNAENGTATVAAVPVSRTIAEKVLDYEDFNELVKLTVLNEVMREVWAIFYPAGVRVDGEELAGIMEDYTHWCETSRSIDDYGMVPFLVFQEWFLALTHKLVKYRAVVEGFELSEEVDFLRLAGLSDTGPAAQREREQEEQAIAVSVCLFSDVIADLAGQLCEALLSDRENAIQGLCERQCEQLVAEVVSAMCREVVLVQIGSLRDLVQELGTAVVREVVLEVLEEVYYEPVGLRLLLEQTLEEEVVEVVQVSLQEAVDEQTQLKHVSEWCEEVVLDEEVLDVAMECYAEARVEQLELSLLDEVMYSVTVPAAAEVVQETYSAAMCVAATAAEGIAEAVLGEVSRELLRGLAIEAKLDHNALLQSLMAAVVEEFVWDEAHSLSGELLRVSTEEQRKQRNEQLVLRVYEEVLAEVVRSEVLAVTGKVRGQVLSIVELFARGEVVSEVVQEVCVAVVAEAVAQRRAEEQQEEEQRQIAAAVAVVVEEVVVGEEVLAVAEEVREQQQEEEQRKVLRADRATAKAAAAASAAAPPRYLSKTQSFIIKEKPKVLGRSANST